MFGKRSEARDSRDRYADIEVRYLLHRMERNDYRVIEERKNSTLFFDALSPGKFDSVVAPIGLEPGVQATYYLRVKYFVSEHTSVVPSEVPQKS